MLALAQRRARPVAFRSATILGGSSLVVGAGALAQGPAAPASLDFRGYNTLSLKATLAGLSGADSFVCKLGCLDPESAAGALLPSSVAASTILTAGAAGDFAGIITLPHVIGAGPNFVLATADNTDGGWVNQVGSPVDLYKTISTIGDSATYARFAIGASGNLAIFDCTAGFTSPGTTSGFELHVTARFNAITDIRNAKVIFHWAKNSGGDVIQKSIGTTASTPSIPIVNDGAFHDYTYNLTAGDITTAGGLAAIFASQFFRLQMDFSGVTTGGGSIDVADFYVRIPPGGTGPGGGGGSGGSLILPFFRNALIFDNSASAHATTISAVRAELTNA
jgi:hypothetical protein